MVYESFRTTRRKIFKSWNKTEDNSNEIKEQQDTNVVINNQLVASFPFQNDFQKSIRFDTGWSAMESTGVGELRLTLRKVWEVNFSPFPERFISFIKIDPVVRVGSNGNGSDNGHVVLTSDFFKKQILFNVEDIPDNPNNKIVVIEVSLWLGKSNDLSSLPGYEVNLFIEFHNPTEFV